MHQILKQTFSLAAALQHSQFLDTRGAARLEKDEKRAVAEAADDHWLVQQKWDHNWASIIRRLSLSSSSPHKLYLYARPSSAEPHKHYQDCMWDTAKIIDEEYRHIRFLDGPTLYDVRLTTEPVKMLDESFLVHEDQTQSSLDQRNTGAPNKDQLIAITHSVYDAAPALNKPNKSEAAKMIRDKISMLFTEPSNHILLDEVLDMAEFSRQRKTAGRPLLKKT